MKMGLASVVSLMTVSGVLGFCTVRPGLAGELIRFSAVHTINIEASYALPIGDEKDHALRMIKSSGTNKSNGPTPFLDAATETEVTYGDDSGGHGPHHGYILYTATDGTLLNQFDGYGTTVMVDGKPSFIAVGSWHTVRGTGRYEGGMGAGSYRSEGGKTEWDGTFQKF